MFLFLSQKKNFSYQYPVDILPRWDVQFTIISHCAGGSRVIFQVPVPKTFWFPLFLFNQKGWMYVYLFALRIFDGGIPRLKEKRIIGLAGSASCPPQQLFHWNLTHRKCKSALRRPLSSIS